MMISYVIPARKGSKSLPFKNRKLLDYTIETLPVGPRIIISTDDEVIQKKIKRERPDIEIVHRSEETGCDTASTKSVVVEVVEKIGMEPSDEIVLLPLTYPQRTYENIQEVIDFYDQHGCDSVVTRKDVKEHPYLSFYAIGDHKGKLVVDHTLYRRQDYPTCFQMQHVVVVCKVGILEKLDSQLVYENTYFYTLKNFVDVDTVDDLERFKSNG